MQEHVQQHVLYFLAKTGCQFEKDSMIRLIGKNWQKVK